MINWERLFLNIILFIMPILTGVIGGILFGAIGTVSVILVDNPGKLFHIHCFTLTYQRETGCISLHLIIIGAFAFGAMGLYLAIKDFFRL